MKFIKFESKSKKIVQLQKTLDKTNIKIQELCDDVLTLTSSEDTVYSGNAYKNYDSAVTALDKKYRGIDDWGNIQTGNIIDVRSAFIIAQGLKIKIKDKKAKKEIEFAKKFLEENSLDQEMPMEYAKESEIEGKFLAELIWNADTLSVGIRYHPYTPKKYFVVVNPEDFREFVGIKYNKNTKDIAIAQESFTYRKFGGRIHEPNKPGMKTWKCLTQIDDVDKALRDYREINSLFASPIPHIECATPADAKAANDVIQKINWKLRKMFAHTGQLLYASPSIAGADMIVKEVETKSKIISGSTGVPVHFLGFPDLLSNRATAENLLELIWASTTKEREIWESCYNELLTKAIVIYNDKSQKTKLDPEKVGLEIKGIPQDQLAWLKDFYLPAYMTGKISLDLFLSKIPGIDVEAEKALQEADQATFLERSIRETDDSGDGILEKIDKKEESEDGKKEK